MISSINISNIKSIIKSNFYLKIFISNISIKNWIRNILIYILSLKKLIFKYINYNFLYLWKYILYSIYLSWNNSSISIFSIVFNLYFHLLLSKIKSSIKWKIFWFQDLYKYLFYFIKWKNYSSSHNFWKFVFHLFNFKDLIQEFHSWYSNKSLISLSFIFISIIIIFKKKRNYSKKINFVDIYFILYSSNSLFSISFDLIIILVYI